MSLFLHRRRHRCRCRTLGRRNRRSRQEPWRGQSSPCHRQARPAGRAGARRSRSRTVRRSGSHGTRPQSQIGGRAQSRALHHRNLRDRHGVGLCDEYPAIVYAEDAINAYDGIFEPGMTVCVEAYIGEEQGPDGIKLEQQVMITENGSELLSNFPSTLR